MGLIVADMDEDGYLDAATGTYCGGVAVLLGNNNGTFGRTTHISESSTTSTARVKPWPWETSTRMAIWTLPSAGL